MGALKLGMCVRVCGLMARPELNGLEGVLTMWDDKKSRWQVELKNGDGAKLFRPVNLEEYDSGESALDVLREKISTPFGSKAGIPSGMNGCFSRRGLDDISQDVDKAIIRKIEL